MTRVNLGEEAIIRFFLAALAIACTSLSIFAQSKGAAPPKPAAPAPKVERRVAFAVGERLNYDVSWSSYLTAGTLSMTVESKKPSYNSTAYYVTAEAQTIGVFATLYTLYYKADSLIDVFTLLPQRGSLYSREGGDQRTKVTMFNQAANTGKFEMQTKSKMEKDLKLKALTQDMLSALYVLRSISPRPGDKLEIPVSDSGWNYMVTFNVGAAEAVKIANGTSVSALRITPTVINEEGKDVGKGFVLWLANDATLKPVRMEGPLAAGHVVLALK